MNQITTVGVDLAKDLIVACAADVAGRTQFYKRFGFHGFAAWAANLPPCTIAMEACSSAHYWARTSTASAQSLPAPSSPPSATPLTSATAARWPPGAA